MKIFFLAFIIIDNIGFNNDIHFYVLAVLNHRGHKKLFFFSKSIFQNIKYNLT